jgi:hypothetical protein
MWITVKHAFTLKLYGEFPTLLSIPLVTPDIFSGVYHPSPTTYLMVSSFKWVVQFLKDGVPFVHPKLLAKLLRLLPSTLYSKKYTTTSDCSKPPWGLLFPLEVPGMFTGQRVHQVKVRDSGNLVTSLVQAGNKPARYYATIRASELGPLFTSAYFPWTGYSRTGSEQKSAPIHILTD